MNLDALFGTTALALGDVLDHLGLFGSQVRATWRSLLPAAAGPGDEDGGGAPIGEPDDDDGYIEDDDDDDDEDDEDDEEPMQL